MKKEQKIASYLIWAKNKFFKYLIELSQVILWVIFRSTSDGNDIIFDSFSCSDNFSNIFLYYLAFQIFTLFTYLTFSREFFKEKLNCSTAFRHINTGNRVKNNKLLLNFNFDFISSFMQTHIKKDSFFICLILKREVFN